MNASFSVETVAMKTPALQPLQLKVRRALKGHQAKVLCLDWAADGQHMVSSSQVKYYILFYPYQPGGYDCYSQPNLVCQH